MRSLLLLSFLVLSSIMAVGQQVPSGPRISAPTAALHDDPIVVSVSGLNAGALYSLRAEFVSRAGTVWRAEAQFRASEKGVIELASMAPISGSYAGVDPLGLFWSMENTKERQTDPSRRSTSSWTSGGTDVPFAPFVKSEAFDKTRRLVDLYNASLDMAPPEAKIPVERISGPILLLSGKDDALWPSTKMANEMANRLAQHHFRYSVTNRSFDDVGHHVASIPMRPTADSVRLGGKPQALAKTQLQALARDRELSGHEHARPSHVLGCLTNRGLPR